MMATVAKLKLKKAGKTIRPSRYDLNQILHDYIVEVTNRFITDTNLTMIECLMKYGQMFMTLYRRQGSRTSPRKEMQKSKMAEEALQIAVKRREVKSNGQKERYTHLNAEFQE